MLAAISLTEMRTPHEVPDGWRYDRGTPVKRWRTNKVAAGHNAKRKAKRKAQRVARRVKP